MKTLALLLLCSPVFAQTYDYVSTLSTGTITASVTLDNGLLTSYSAEFNAANGLILALDTGYASGGHLDTFAPASVYTNGAGNSIAIGDAITFSFGESIFHSGNLTMDFGGGTDRVEFTNSGWNPICGGEFGAATYCLIQATGTSGKWTQAIHAPEIEPVGGIGAFLLLATGLTIIRSRK